MSFILKNPIIAPVSQTKQVVDQMGTRGIYPKSDGWYEVDDNGTERKLVNLDIDGKIPEDEVPLCIFVGRLASYAAWSEANTYGYNDVVSYGGKNWRALNKVPPNQVPDSSPKYWSEIVSPLPVFPDIGTEGKLYIDGDINKIFMWDGYSYMNIPESVNQMIIDAQPINPGTTGWIRFLSGDNISMDVVGRFPVVKISYRHNDPLLSVDNTLVVNKEYSLGTQQTLNIVFPSVDIRNGDVIYVNFQSGEVPTNLTIDTTNTNDFELTPEPNSGYEIFAKYNGEFWVVGCSEYTRQM